MRVLVAFKVVAITSRSKVVVAKNLQRNHEEETVLDSKGTFVVMEDTRAAQLQSNCHNNETIQHIVVHYNYWHVQTYMQTVQLYGMYV